MACFLSNAGSGFKKQMHESLVRRKGPVAGVRQERLMRGEYGERVRVEK
jgi:hypothetical protein